MRATTVVVLATAVSLPFGQSTVGVQLPGIRHSFPGSHAAVVWVANGYNVAFAALLLVAGVLADRWGRRRTFIGGTVLYVVGCIACAVAPTLLALDVARLVSGAAAAAQLACLPALIVAAHPEAGAARARAFGQLGTGFGIGIGLGPLLGGVIVDGVGWRGAFLLGVPFALVSLAAAWRLGETRGEAASASFDLVGAGTFILALGLLVGGLSEAGDASTRTAPVLLPIVLGLVVGAVFIRYENGRTRTERPALLPLKPLKNPQFLAAVTSWWAASAGFVSLFILLPEWVDESGHGQSAAGLLMLCLAVPMLAMPAVTPRVVGRWGEGRVLPVAVGLIAVGDLVASRGHADSFSVVLVLGLVVIGTGTGTLNGLVDDVAVSTFPAAQSGVAAGTFQSVRVTGDAIGTALAIVLVSAFHGVADAVLVAAANGLVAALLVAWLLRRRTSPARSPRGLAPCIGRRTRWAAGTSRRTRER